MSPDPSHLPSIPQIFCPGALTFAIRLRLRKARVNNLLTCSTMKNISDLIIIVQAVQENFCVLIIANLTDSEAHNYTNTVSTGGSRVIIKVSSTYPPWDTRV